MGTRDVICSSRVFIEQNNKQYNKAIKPYHYGSICCPFAKWEDVITGQKGG